MGKKVITKTISLQNCVVQNLCAKEQSLSGRHSLTHDRRNEAFCRLNFYNKLLLKFLYLFGLLQGDGLDRPEELVLRVLSGLLSEHIRSIFKVLWQASQSRLPLHLVRREGGRGGSRVRRYPHTSQTLQCRKAGNSSEGAPWTQT